jgi:hypothetical protein
MIGQHPNNPIAYPNTVATHFRVSSCKKAGVDVVLLLHAFEMHFNSFKEVL